MRGWLGYVASKNGIVRTHRWRAVGFWGVAESRTTIEAIFGCWNRDARVYLRGMRFVGLGWIADARSASISRSRVGRQWPSERLSGTSVDWRENPTSAGRGRRKEFAQAQNGGWRMGWTRWSGSYLAGDGAQIKGLLGHQFRTVTEIEPHAHAPRNLEQFAFVG